jgi:polar amino acid transport system substrate-binding protein
MKKIAVFAVALALAAAGCGKTTNVQQPSATGTPTPETTYDKCVIDQGSTAPAPTTGTSFATLKTGELLVGSDTAYPPFESIEGGKVVGFDVDLMEALAKKLSPPLTVKFQTADFKTIFTALAAHKYDLVVSAVTIKATRKETIDFTDPYFKADQSIAVDTAKQPSIKTIDDLAGVTVGAQDGTTGKDCADALKAAGKVKEVRAYKEIPTAFSDLSAGRIGAVLNDLPTSKRIVEQRGGTLKIVQIVRTKEAYGIAVAKDNPNLRGALNAALAAMKADGSYSALFEKWFQTKPPEL